MKAFALVIILNFYAFSLPAEADNYLFATNLNAQQIQLNRDTEPSWITNSDVTAANGFAAIRKLMTEDPIIYAFIQQMTAQLQSHGVQRLEDIVRICPPDDSTASGYTNPSAKVVEVRPKLPGLPEIAWSEGALQAIRNAYSYRIISRPFMEYLAVQSYPTVCVKSGEKIRRAYSIFVHEFVHFSQQDPFENLVPKDTYDMVDLLNSMINPKGGELDAFKMQIGAEIRLLARMGVQNPNVNLPFAYADLNGKITDVEGLRQYIFSTYTVLIDTKVTRSKQIKGVLENNNYRTAFLRDYVVPTLRTFNDLKSVEAAQKEITKLEAANASLKTLYAEFL